MIPQLLFIVALLLISVGLSAKPVPGPKESTEKIRLELVDSAFLQVNEAQDYWAFVPTADKYYFVDNWSGLICVYDHQGRFIRRIGTIGKGPGKFSWVLGIAVQDSVVYGTGKNSILINKFDTAGKFLDYWKLDSIQYASGMLNLCVVGDGSLLADQTYRGELEPILTKRGKFKGPYPVSPLMRIDFPERKTHRIAFTLKAWSEIKVARNYPEFWNVLTAPAPFSPDKAYCCWNGIPSLFEIDTRLCTGKKLCDIPILDWIDVHKQEMEEMDWPNRINSFTTCRVSGRLLFFVDVNKQRRAGKSDSPEMDRREYYFVDSTGSIAYMDRNADSSANDAGIYMQNNAAYFCTVNAGWDPVNGKGTLRVRRFAIKQIK